MIREVYHEVKVCEVYHEVKEVLTSTDMILCAVLLDLAMGMVVTIGDTATGEKGV